VSVWLFDGYVFPGWADWLGLALGAAGFLTDAQRTLSQRALTAVQAQIQTVAADLTFAVMTNDLEVAHRSLVRYGLLAREAGMILRRIDPTAHKTLENKLKATANRATAAKTILVTTSTPDVSGTSQAVMTEIELVNQELGAISSDDKNSIKGAARV
jgi:hypothetical protein